MATNEVSGRGARGAQRARWRRPGVVGVLLALTVAPWPALALGLHLPWHHRAHHAATSAPAPGLNIVVAGQAAGPATVPQSWQRNTLLVDLTRLADAGSATLTPPADTGWPARLAFRVRPGSIASLTVEGAQRVQFTLPARGAAMTLQLDPGVYVVKTVSLTLHWSAADDLPR